MQDEDFVARLDEVCGNEVPAKCSGAGDDEGLRGGRGCLEEFAEQCEGFAKGGDEGGADVGLTKETFSSRQDISKRKDRTGNATLCRARHCRLQWVLG